MNFQGALKRGSLRLVSFMRAGFINLNFEVAVVRLSASELCEGPVGLGSNPGVRYIYLLWHGMDETGFGPLLIWLWPNFYSILPY